MYWNFQQNRCLNIKKHTVHNVHTLAWGLYSCGPSGQLPFVPMRQVNILILTLTIMVSAAVLLGAYNTRGLQIYLLTFTIMVSAAVLLGAYNTRGLQIYLY